MYKDLVDEQLQAQMKIDDTAQKCYEQIEHWKKKQTEYRQEHHKVTSQLRNAIAMSSALDAKIFIETQ